MKMSPTLMACAVSACAACTGPTVQDDTPADNAGRPDSGGVVRFDGGALRFDGGMRSDASGLSDAAGLTMDAAPLPDGAPAWDAASRWDAAAPGDAGTVQADAASPPDAAVADAATLDIAAQYPADALISPVTQHVANRLRSIAGNNLSRDPRVFMKVGASGTVSRNLLWCFAGAAQPQYRLDLDGRAELMAGITWFRSGSADGDTPFDRPTLAAVSGRTASWAITGNPSPVEQETDALNPRFAFVNYGTNDMQMGTTHLSALPGFYTNFTQLLDQLEAGGIVPIITGLNPRSDTSSNPTAPYWVPVYNSVVRAMAQQRQLPFINMYLGSKDLPSMGLLSDGLHGNTYSESGQAQGCVFTNAGLQYNYNVRNLLSMHTLDAVRRVVVDGEAAPDATAPVLRGDGSPGAPFVIDSLPFGHVANTALSPHSNADSYPGCNTTNESGPEYRYALTLDAPTRLRAVVTDAAGVDVDVHLLDATGTPQGCLARADTHVHGLYPAGTYTLALDTWVNGSGTPLPGEYVLVVLACEPSDPDC